ncbi:hypothetical protein HC931_02410 [Candidatus Gracilibacteria bacterium]|nr:hypothetical protein [Candidatus Gracilibacteria bacterium]NJM86633.1 hypothetical protein [Hydrococcus sp. RU_2_2]
MTKNITSKPIISIGLFILFGCTGINLLASEILATPIVFAQASEISLPIARQKQENYENFLRRAEATAAKTIQQRFQENSAIAELRLAILGENQGAIAPVLSIRVSRDKWRREPSINRWATYYPDSKFLLGFEQQPQQLQAKPPTQEQPKPTQPETPQQKPIPPETQPSPTEDPQQSQPESPYQRLAPGAKP